MALQKSAMLNTMSVSHCRLEKFLTDIVVSSTVTLYLPIVCHRAVRYRSALFVCLFVWKLLLTVGDVTIWLL